MYQITDNTDNVGNINTSIPERSQLTPHTSALSNEVDQPLQVVFRDLCFSVKFRKRKADRTSSDSSDCKFILDNLNGTFLPSRLTAIMGPSGSGKTSMLDAIAGNLMGGKITGEVSVNGEDFSRKRMREISGFVFQDDVLLATMTTKEAIKMSAKLRLPATIRKNERRNRVKNMLEVFHLNECRNTIIGSPDQKGVSGGERKRICTAMELIANPPILFLDEPTSGLDTFTAYVVMKSLVRMAHKQHRTVVATVHQPNSDIFRLLDDLVLLYSGRIVYSGPVKNVVKYFEGLGYVFPRYSNPADVIFMDVLRPGARPTRESNLQRFNRKSISDNFKENKSSDSHDGGSFKSYKKDTITGPECLADIWKNSDAYQRLINTIAEAPKLGVNIGAIRRHAPWHVQFGYLFLRASKNAFRNRLILWMQIGSSIFLGVLVGLIYLGTDTYPPPVRIRNFSGVLYFMMVTTFFRGTFGVLNTFHAEKMVFYREYQAGYYTTLPYYISKVVVELPISFFSPYLMVIIMYYIVGLTPAFSSYLMIATFAALSSICGTAFGMLLSSLFDDFKIVLVLTPLFLLPLLLFSGLFVSYGTLPVYLSWIKYVSPLYYGFVGALQVQFTGQLSNCDSKQYECDGQKILDSLSVSTALPIGVDVVFLLTIWITYLILAYIFLQVHIYFKFHRK